LGVLGRSIATLLAVVFAYFRAAPPVRAVLHRL